MKMINDNGKLEKFSIDSIADCFVTDVLVDPIKWEEELCDFIDSTISGTDEEIDELKDIIEGYILYDRSEALSKLESREKILEWIKNISFDEMEYLTPEEILNEILKNYNKE